MSSSPQKSTVERSPRAASAVSGSSCRVRRLFDGGDSLRSAGLLVRRSRAGRRHRHRHHGQRKFRKRFINTGRRRVRTDGRNAQRRFMIARGDRYWSVTFRRGLESTFQQRLVSDERHIPIHKGRNFRGSDSAVAHQTAELGPRSRREPAGPWGGVGSTRSSQPTLRGAGNGAEPTSDHEVFTPKAGHALSRTRVSDKDSHHLSGLGR